MKLKHLISMLVMILLVGSSCHRKIVVFKTPPRNIPPGQAKKMTGSQSAKPFAPGQQKKKKG